MGRKNRGKKYHNWRANVQRYARGLCSACGEVAKVPTVHHMLSWAEHPESRYDVANGVLMCAQCHGTYADGVGG